MGCLTAGYLWRFVSNYPMTQLPNYPFTLRVLWLRDPTRRAEGCLELRHANLTLLPVLQLMVNSALPK